MKHAPKLVVLIVTLVTAQVANAGSIVGFDEPDFINFRILRSERSVVANNITHFHTAAGGWSDSIMGINNAGQDTLISFGFFGGTGYADATLGGVGGGFAFIRTSFEFDSQHLSYSVDLDLLLRGSGQGRAMLTNITTGEAVWSAFLNQEGTMHVTREGTLLPGGYEFTLSTSAAVLQGFTPPSAASSFNGGLTLQPIVGSEVPEPGTMSLIGLGLLGAAIRRRQLKPKASTQKTPDLPRDFRTS